MRCPTDTSVPETGCIRSGCLVPDLQVTTRRQVYDVSLLTGARCAGGVGHHVCIPCGLRLRAAGELDATAAACPLRGAQVDSNLVQHMPSTHDDCAGSLCTLCTQQAWSATIKVTCLLIPSCCSPAVLQHPSIPQPSRACPRKHPHTRHAGTGKFFHTCNRAGCGRQRSLPRRTWYRHNSSRAALCLSQQLAQESQPTQVCLSPQAST